MYNKNNNKKIGMFKRAEDKPSSPKTFMQTTKPCRKVDDEEEDHDETTARQNISKPKLQQHKPYVPSCSCCYCIKTNAVVRLNFTFLKPQNLQRQNRQSLVSYCLNNLYRLPQNY